MKSYENDKKPVLYKVPQFRVRCISGHKCFHQRHPQPSITNSSFCAPVGLLLAKLNHFSNDSIETLKSFG